MPFLVFSILIFIMLAVMLSFPYDLTNKELDTKDILGD
jgi:hypothetical protein